MVLLNTAESAEVAEERSGKVKSLDEITGMVVDAAIKIHREFGPGLLESVPTEFAHRESSSPPQGKSNPGTGKTVCRYRGERLPPQGRAPAAAGESAQNATDRP